MQQQSQGHALQILQRLQLLDRRSRSGHAHVTPRPRPHYGRRQRDATQPLYDPAGHIAAAGPAMHDVAAAAALVGGFTQPQQQQHDAAPPNDASQVSSKCSRPRSEASPSADKHNQSMPGYGLQATMAAAHEGQQGGPRQLQACIATANILAYVMLS